MMHYLKIKGIPLLFLFQFFMCFAQVNTLDHRSLYVDNFSNILGSYTKETKLFEFAEKHGITTLILYDLHKINKRFFLGDSTKNQILADFIKRAKSDYNITKVSASGESGNFFIKAIHPYNVSRKDKIERFDMYNLEYEYWNKPESEPGGYYCETYLKNGQLPCNRESSFKYYIQSLEIMRMLADELDHQILVEAYIGNFRKEEVQQISQHVDRLLIHDYVQREERLFPYVKERLRLLEEINSKVKVSILYSTECRYMGKYLQKHSFYEAEQKFFEELNQEVPNLDEHLNFIGFTYYNFSHYRYVENIKR